MSVADDDFYEEDEPPADVASAFERNAAGRTSSRIGADDMCGQCGHPFGQHALVATMFGWLGGHADMPIGGIIRCPVEDCACRSTWSIPSDLR